MLSKIENKELILMGDINVNFLNRNDHKDIKDILKVNGLKQLISKPTRVTPTTSTLIDVITSNNPVAISNTDVIPSSMSDHDIIGCVRKINTLKFKQKTITCRSYAKYDPNNLCTDLANVNWNEFYTLHNVDKAWSLMKTTLLTVFDRHAPLVTKRVKGRVCPWMNSDITDAMKERDKVLRKARKSKNTSDWTLYKRLRNRCTEMIRSAKSMFHKTLLCENAKNPRKFWQCIKSIIPTKSQKSTSSAVPFIEYEPNDSTTFMKSRAQSKENIFCKFFSNAAKSLKERFIPLTDFIWKPPPLIPSRTNKTFTMKYVSKVFIENQLKKLKRHKATGIDNLPTCLLKDSASIIARPLSHLINLSIKTSTVPTEWKVARVNPLHKSGNTTNPDNYLPISILPVLSKIMEKAIHSQLIEYLETNSLITNRQFGYRSNHSTELAATLLLDKIRKDVDTCNMVGAVFVDLSKAFDTIGHSILLSKLRAHGILQNELAWFRDYLFNRRQIVSYDGILSDPEPVVCGVPQGSILGPLMFLIFFNDFDESLQYSNSIMFADNTVIYYENKSFEIIQQRLNKEMVSIASYFTENELVINLKKNKTESMLFGTAKKLSKTAVLEIYYNHHLINQACQYEACYRTRTPPHTPKIRETCD